MNPAGAECAEESASACEGSAQRRGFQERERGERRVGDRGQLGRRFSGCAALGRCGESGRGRLELLLGEDRGVRRQLLGEQDGRTLAFRVVGVGERGRGVDEAGCDAEAGRMVVEGVEHCFQKLEEDMKGRRRREQRQSEAWREELAARRRKVDMIDRGWHAGRDPLGEE